MRSVRAARVSWAIVVCAAHLAAGCDETVASDDDDRPVPEPVCGDGEVSGDEGCDEGEANGTVGHCLADCSRTPNVVAIDGDVMAFYTEVRGPRISGAKVSVLEHPELTATTGADAHFRFEGLLEGEDVTLLVEHPDIKPTQTATITLGPLGVAAFSVQVLPTSLFDALSALVPLPVEEESHCVIASTVARFGGSLYVSLRQGLPNTEVALDPAPPADSGPIYFDEQVLPDLERPSTSIDGGVFYYRLDPGDYVMSASRSGFAFNTVRLHCVAGRIVNAGPPLGLLAHVRAPEYGAGRSRPDDEASASTDALCDTTAACVNQSGNGSSYPNATLKSCKAMFRDVWAEVEDACDGSGVLRNAAMAVYDCRAASCDAALGGDDACAEQEAAFRSAETSYGACVNGLP